MSLAEERAARNESLFREVNEHVERLRHGSHESGAQFVCECADDTCVERLTIPPGVYEQVRANPRRFLVRPGHQQVEVEEIVMVSDDFLVVEKRGEAGRVAARTDPRASNGG